MVAARGATYVFVYVCVGGSRNNEKDDGDEEYDEEENKVHPKGLAKRRKRGRSF